MVTQQEIALFQRDLKKRGFNALMAKWGPKKTHEILEAIKTQGDDVFNTYLTVMERDIVGLSMSHGHVTDARAVIEKHIGSESVNESTDMIDVMENDVVDE